MSVLVVLALVAAACGGDDSDDEASSDEATEETQSDGDEESNGEDSDDEDSNDEDSNDEGSNDPDSDGEDTGFGALTGRQAEAVIKIEYVLDDDDEMTIAYDGSTEPARAAIRQGDSLTLAPGDGSSVQCDLGSDPPTCTETFLPGDFISFAAATAFGGFGFLLLDSEGGFASLPFVDVEESSEEIAGRSASCVTWDLTEIAESFGDVDDNDTGSFTGCLDDESGWPLSFVATDGSGNPETEMRAVSVSEPTDDDFEAPAAVESLDEELGELGDEFGEIFDELGNVEGLEDLDIGDLNLDDLLGDIEIPDSSG